MPRRRLEMPTMEKQKVQAVLDSFGGDVDVDAFLEKIAVLDDIERGERQIVAGRIERICR
jgi:predicted metal-dependent HD superfamily phosphohydrolase